MKNSYHPVNQKITFAGLLITLGIVFGDIGTSPLYVVKAILSGSEGQLTKDFIYGFTSCIFWTLTLQTTIKYVLITLRADNRGEGGILALYALLRKRRKWLVTFAIIGGSALLADGVITPAITVTSSIEGLKLMYPQISVLPVVALIILGLFVIQQFGTSALGKSLGPIMILWFGTLFLMGLPYLLENPAILTSVNPVYAVKLILTHPQSLMIMGAVFLATTGAEALYSDLGHCGIGNIRVSWIFVKIALLTNYFGQAAFIMTQGENFDFSTNPFFAIMPEWFLPIGTILATLAAIIASQALISGTYTIISEAIQLNLWPKLKIVYPTNRKGQMYIPAINWILMILTLIAVFLFRDSSNMEAAYGLSITITMLMTTFLMIYFLKINRVSIYWRIFFGITYFGIELVFFIANITKFSHGGWFTIVLAGMVSFIMYTWYTARKLKNSFTSFVPIKDYYPLLMDLKEDETIPLYCSNLVYLTRADKKTDIESKIIYSIFNKRPKRVRRYWMIHLDICDDPHTMEYSVDHLIPDELIRIEFRIGFKVQPRINLFFRQVLDDMVKQGEINVVSEFPSLYKHNVMSDFQFILIKRIQNYDFDFPPFYQFIMDVYVKLAKFSQTDIRAYGLDTSSVIEELVPLSVKNMPESGLKRVFSKQ